MRNLRKILRKNTSSGQKIGRRPQLKINKKAMKQCLLEEDTASDNSEELKWDYSNQISPAMVKRTINPNSDSEETAHFGNKNVSYAPSLNTISEGNQISDTETRKEDPSERDDKNKGLTWQQVDKLITDDPNAMERINRYLKSKTPVKPMEYENNKVEAKLSLGYHLGKKK